MTCRLGIDIGGTFTDLVAFDEESGSTWSIKVPTTPQEPSVGTLRALKIFLSQYTGPIRLLVHASTIGTNLFLGQVHLRLPKAALLTTEGFRDVLEIGRQRRGELYNLFYERPRPLIRRRYRYGVRERVDAQGAVVEPLDEAQVMSIADDLGREGIEAVAVCYLHSYQNPVHEEKTRMLLLERLGAPVVLSSQIDPHYREYERTSTTVINALLIPVVSQYLQRLEDDLRALGIVAPMYAMQSSGGMTTLRGASALPAAVIESGPAAGVVGAAYLGRSLGLGDLLSFDMGGTTAKAGAVVGGTVQVVTEYEVAGKVHAGRIIKGSGYPVRFPFIDLAEVSAGGGTVAWTEGGSLRVGPLSAGAVPGPAAYGQGGTEPTVTDCNLLLGRLSSRGLLDGQIPLDLAAAREAIDHVATKVGLDSTRMADGVLRIVHTQMVRALRLVSLERGYDPRKMALVAFGGAGAMHAAFLADELGVPEVLVPPAPGLFSALGLLVADVRRDAVRAILQPASAAIQAAVDAAFVQMSAELRHVLADEGFPPDAVVVERLLELRYQGQSYELTVPAGPVDEAVGVFHRRHREVYGYMAAEEPVEVVSCRVVAYGRLPKPRMAAVPATTKAPTPGEMREVFFDGWHSTPVHKRQTLGATQTIAGPAIIEQYDTTIVVPPQWRMLVEPMGILRLFRGDRPAPPFHELSQR